MEGYSTGYGYSLSLGVLFTYIGLYSPKDTFKTNPFLNERRILNR